jgi:MFS family permease
MSTASTASVAVTSPVAASDRWTRYNATVLTICILGWAFDIYEATIMQLVTPILIKEWGITPATMGTVTTISRWIGLIGTFAFPVLADLYGRKPALIWAILGYSIFTGLTGFSTGWIMLLIFSSITRIALAGENPVGMLMVTETAPTKWRATALGGLVGGYPFGYMLCSLAALVVVPLWGWRSLYFLGILPALLVLWIRIGIMKARATSASPRRCSRTG